MDDVKKSIRKLQRADRVKADYAIEQIRSGNFAGLNIIKMTGGKYTYRVRAGNVRIIYILKPGQDPQIIWVGYRSEKTYRDI
jgi:mRNA-degrading endonuclease RelE of RelBE toxin-antitoxin system